MKALTLNGHGDGALAFAELPEPLIGPDDVLIRVHAASVNPSDVRIMEGGSRYPAPPAFPHVLGRDAAGVIVKAGANVTRLGAGDRVFAVADRTRWGAQAELMAVPAATTAHAPQGVSFVEAGSLPVAGLSAVDGLITVGKLQRGERVLIHGGAGAVGSIAVQIAKMIGAHVTVTASTGSVAHVKGLGADAVIDHTTTDFTRGAQDYDLVFDLVGGDVRFRSFQVVKPGGRIVHISVPPMTQAAPRSDVTVAHARVPYDPALLDKIAGWVNDKAIRPVLDSVFPFADAMKAYARVATGHARGRTMLDLNA